MYSLEKSTYAKKHKVKRLGDCYKCACWSCHLNYRSLRYVFDNYVNKIQFIRHVLTRELFSDKILLTFKLYPSGYEQREIQGLVTQFLT